MRILLKHILRNLLANKKRSFALVFCMAVVAFSAMLAFAQSDSAGATLRSLLFAAYGDAELMVNNSTGDDTPLTCPDDCRLLYMNQTTVTTQYRDAAHFSYASRRQFSLAGMDPEQGVQFGLLPIGQLTLGENEVAVTEAAARSAGLEVGSTIAVMSCDKEPFELTVAAILPNEKFFNRRPNGMLGSMELVRKLAGADTAWQFCFIDPPDSADVNALCTQLEQDNPGMDIQNLFAVVNQGMDEFFMMFFGIFLLLALIIFVVASGVSEHVIRERMSQLGTLRSLGTTRSAAALTLIAENLLYGLTGAVLGILLYLPVNTPLLRALVPVASGTPMQYRIKGSSVVIVLLITVLLATFSALKAVLKAVRIPLRDIIFGGRDSAYHLNRRRAYIGLALIVVCPLVSLMAGNGFVILLALVGLVVGEVFFLPLLLQWVRQLSSKAKNPIFRFACNNMATKKTIVSSAVLFTVVMSLVLSVIMLVTALGAALTESPYTGDIIITGLSQRADHYRFISRLEGVSAAELQYEYSNFAEINGKMTPSRVSVIAWDGGYEIYRGVKDVPETLDATQVSLDQKTMRQMNISPGDEVRLTLNAKGERPIRLTLTAAEGCDTGASNYSTRDSIVIHADLYKQYFLDYPAAAMLRLEEGADPDQIKAQIDTFIMDNDAHTYTAAEYAAEESSGQGALLLLLGSIIGIGCLLSIVLLTTNQSIGFEQRRKELAVLHSTAMSRSQLRRTMAAETAVSLGIAIVWALVSALMKFRIILCFVNAISSGGALSITLHWPGLIAGFLLLMYLLAQLTSLVSARSLSRMNTAEQIKYE